MNRTSPFAIGLIGAGLTAVVALGADRLQGEEYFAERNAVFARAGVPVARQCHRHDLRPDCLIMDHIVPLCLGAPDELSNIQLQEHAESLRKDQVERWACSLVRQGRLTREAAKAIFTEHKGAW